MRRGFLVSERGDEGAAGARSYLRLGRIHIPDANSPEGALGGQTRKNRLG